VNSAYRNRFNTYFHIAKLSFFLGFMYWISFALFAGSVSQQAAEIPES
jgi:hypothetical protein